MYGAGPAPPADTWFWLLLTGWGSYNELGAGLGAVLLFDLDGVQDIRPGTSEVPGPHAFGLEALWPIR